MFYVDNSLLERNKPLPVFSAPKNKVKLIQRPTNLSLSCILNLSHMLTVLQLVGRSLPITPSLPSLSLSLSFSAPSGDIDFVACRLLQHQGHRKASLSSMHKQSTHMNVSHKAAQLQYTSRVCVGQRALINNP